MSWPWSGRNGIARSARPARAALGFLAQRGGDQRHHVGVAGQMLGLVERARHRLILALDVAQVQEMHAVAEPLHHAGQIVVGPRAERAGAERDAVGRAVHRIEERAVVGLGRHDARQAEERERRVVRMAAEPHAEVLGDRHDLLQEGDEVTAQRSGVDRGIFGEMGAHVLQREVLRRPRQPEDDVGGQGDTAAFVHRAEALLGCLADLLGKARRGALALEDADVEGGEIDEVEAHAGAAMGKAVGRDRCASSRAPA